MPGRRGQVLNRRRRHAAAPEERVDLAVLQRAGRFGDAELWRVMSLRGSSPAAASTRSAMSSVPLPGEPTETTRPFRSAIALDPAALPHDDVRVVRVQHRQRAHAADGAGVLERPASRHAAGKRVRQREREIDLAELHAT